MLVYRSTNLWIMDRPWYQKLFSRSQSHNLESTQAKANEGDPGAQFSLGLKYASGEGADQDYVQAAQWYLKAADQGHGLAQFNLGTMYSEGQGLVRDDATALTWFHKAARQGDAGAQFSLGMRHYRASLWGPTKDSLEARTEAYKWFCLALAQGYMGSASICESLNLSMTHEEVADGNRRAAAFVVAGPA